MQLPKHLVQATRKGQVIPFVGAGVSLGVQRNLFPSWKALLEKLATELEEERGPEAAAELRGHVARDNYLEAAEVALQQLGAFLFNRFLRNTFRVDRPSTGDLAVVRALWSLKPSLVLTTNYDDVLAWGAEHAERLANDQLDELALMHDEEHPHPARPRIWHLHGTIHRLSTIILGGSDYERLYGAREAAPGLAQDERSRQQNAYRSYAWAVNELNKQLSSRPFLYVGFSFSDEYVLRQVKHVLQGMRGKSAPSYALMKKGEGNRAHLWSQYNIQLIEYEDHGAPLASLLEALREAAFPEPSAPPSVAMEMHAPELESAWSEDMPMPALIQSAPQARASAGHASDDFIGAPVSRPQAPHAPVPAASARPSPQPPPRPPPPADLPHAFEFAGPPAAQSAPGGAASGSGAPAANRAAPALASPAQPKRAPRPPHVPRLELVKEYARILENEHRLVLLAPKRGGARTLARQVAERYGPRVTWLAPPNHPDASESEYCRVLAGDERVTDFEGLLAHLRKNAAALGGNHLVVLRYEWGSLAHLTTLGNYLRKLLEERSEVRFHVLVAGGVRSAWLIHNVERFSAFKDAPRRQVPDCTVDEVRQLLAASGVDGARFATEVHAATGGHLGLLNEALAGGGPFDEAAVTALLARSPVLRETVRDRLREDGRGGLRPHHRRHARFVLSALLAGQEVQSLDTLDNNPDDAEVRLYFDGLVRRDASGRTVLRCQAAALAAREALEREDGRP